MLQFKKRYISHSIIETAEIGREIASYVEKGDVFVLNGALGTGKSALVRGICAALGVTEEMPSPTFTIVNEYNAKFKIYHFDLYRIKDPFELYETAFEEYVYSEAVSFIEWPEKGGDLIPQKFVSINITLDGKKRVIEVENH